MDKVIEVTVPQENVNDEFVTLISWLVQNGEIVAKGQDILELENSKATFALPASVEGHVYYNIQVGCDVRVGATICYISPLPLDSSAQAHLFARAEVLRSHDPADKAAASLQDTTTPDYPSGTRFSNEAVKMIKDAEISPSVFRSQGLVRKKDVLAYLARSETIKSSSQPKADVEAAGAWVIHDSEPSQTGAGIYSRQFIRRMVGGTYGGGQVGGFRKILADTAWGLHLLAFAIVWLLAKLPVISSWLEIISRIYKRNMFGFFIRGAYYKARLEKMGMDVIVDQGVEIWGPENVSIGSGCHLDMNARIAAGERKQNQHGSVEIGSHVHIGPMTQLAGRGGIKIGSYTAITAGTKIFSATNVGDNLSDPTDLLPMSHAAPIDRQRIVEAPVVIEDHVFVGLNVCILPGVKIGRGAIINSGAVVTRNVPSFTVVKGATMSFTGVRLPKTHIEKE